ncbi:MAG TPA: glycine cleavage system protein GcvH [Homoserinimonas sp.]|nr:glycine cleavage system protein GcvH [Homoserinimonas sp.]
MTELKYTADHEWIRTDGNVLTIGITAYAADKLGEIVFAELPTAGQTVEAGKVVAEVESTKSVGEVFAPVSGTVTEVNDDVVDNPDFINDSPLEKGWLFKVEVADPAVLDGEGFLTLDAYNSLIGE